MLENLIFLDKEIFLYINNLPHSNWLITVFRFITDLESFGIVWIVIALILVIFKLKTKNLFPKLILALIVSAFISQGMIKPLVGRLRPQYQLMDVRVFAKESDYLAFPSSHAATAFAGAFILSKFFKKGRGYFYSLAVLIALSRVYLAVHYPLDVIFGSLLGLAMGWLVNYIYDKPWKLNLKILSIAIFTLAVLIFPGWVSAKTMLNISPQSLEFYEEQQVLGVSSDSDNTKEEENSRQLMAITDKLLKVATKGKRVVVEFFDSESGSQEVDEISVSNQEGGEYMIVNEANKLFIKDKIAKAATSLPLIIKQVSGQIYVQTNGGDKLLVLLPDEARQKLQDLGELPLEFELKDDQASLQYSFTRGEKKKFLGIIPINTTVTTKISADTGEVRKSLSWKLPKISF